MTHGMTYGQWGGKLRYITEHTVLDDSENYVVIAKFKRDEGDPYIKQEGTFADCDDYAERNNSPDNPEHYFVMRKED